MLHALILDNMLELTEALVFEWEQTSVTKSQHLDESLKAEEWRLLQQHINAHGLGITYSTITYVWIVQVSYFVCSESPIVVLHCALFL